MQLANKNIWGNKFPLGNRWLYLLLIVGVFLLIFTYPFVSLSWEMIQVMFPCQTLSNFLNRQNGETHLSACSHRGTRTTLRLCLRMIYFKRIIGKDLSLLHVWRYDVWRLQVSETLKMCGSRYIKMVPWMMFFWHVVVQSQSISDQKGTWRLTFEV